MCTAGRPGRYHHHGRRLIAPRARPVVDRLDLAANFRPASVTMAYAMRGKPESLASQPIIPVLPQGPVYCIDVECAATGTGHNDREMIQIGLVDSNETVLCNLYVTPDKAVVSYLTPLTGINAELIAQYGMPKVQALAALKACLPPNAIIVGQNISTDIKWLELQEGRDFGSLVDLVGLFRTWNERYKSFSYFGLEHEVSMLLGINDAGQAHNAVTDAIKSMRLFNLYLSLQADPASMEAVRRKLLSQQPAPSFARLNPTFEGVCMGNRKTCQCGSPFFS